MSEKITKILGTLISQIEDVKLPSGMGVLPSKCPDCQGKLDFGNKNEDELICRNKCGWRMK